MPVVVRPSGYQFGLEIEAGKDKLKLKLKQLTYKEKGLITSLATSNKAGVISQDTSLVVFYNLKYAVKGVEGLTDEEGNPYKLTFDEDGSLTDECVDELLGTPFSDSMQFAALKLSEPSFPSQVVHPLTNKPIEGVSVIPADKLNGPRKKSTKQSK